jgi:hypothetical protein
MNSPSLEAGAFQNRVYLTFVALAGRLRALAPADCARQRTPTLLFSDV